MEDTDLQINWSRMNEIFENIATKLGIQDPSTSAIEWCISTYEKNFLDFERHLRSVFSRSSTQGQGGMGMPTLIAYSITHTLRRILLWTMLQ
ncbi:hypothetical protein QCA50_006227 [Cerrena zonata]|uniref:Reverse transcriptase domain-containing protein n=1 Tax=Cerrena zonata TaxID=2478898 RepID=A0AAW0GH83_9APHY